MGGQRRLDLRGLLSSQASKNRELQLPWRPSLKNEEPRDRRSPAYTSGLHMHVNGWAHLHIHTPQACMHIRTLTRKKPILTPDRALSNARRPRCLRPLEAEISRPAAVQLRNGKKLMFHLPPFHSVRRSSWGKEGKPQHRGVFSWRPRARSNRFSQQEIHWVEEWSEFLGNQVFSSRVLYHESYLWSLWARQVSESHRDCLSIIDFGCCCLPSWRIPQLFFFSFFRSHPIV